MPDEKRHESADLEDYEDLDSTDTLDGPPGDDPLDRGVVTPDRWSAGVRFGTTGEEQAEGESLDELLAEVLLDVRMLVELPKHGADIRIEMDRKDDLHVGPVRQLRQSRANILETFPETFAAMTGDENHLLGFVEGDAHVLDEVLDVKAGLEVAGQDAGAKDFEGLAAGGADRDRFEDGFEIEAGLVAVE